MNLLELGKKGDGEMDSERRFKLEFNLKLQELRKYKGMTQEHLAEKLFVSRTAISKWESGRGYPNLESLKELSKVFEVSIDDLLSGDELICLASNENHSNLNKIFGYIYSILDIMAVLFILLPLYSQPMETFIKSVSLIEYTNSSQIIIAAYWIIFFLLITIGIIEFILIYLDKVKLTELVLKISIVLHSLAIVFCIATREPYVSSLLFVFFILKGITLFKRKKDL